MKITRKHLSWFGILFGLLFTVETTLAAEIDSKLEKSILNAKNSMEILQIPVKKFLEESTDDRKITLKKSYRDLAKTFHPDKFASSSDELKTRSEKLFTKISNAKDELDQRVDDLEQLKKEYLKTQYTESSTEKQRQEWTSSSQDSGRSENANQNSSSTKNFDDSTFIYRAQDLMINKYVYPILRTLYQSKYGGVKKPLTISDLAELLVLNENFIGSRYYHLSLMAVAWEAILETIEINTENPDMNFEKNALLLLSRFLASSAEIDEETKGSIAATTFVLADRFLNNFSSRREFSEIRDNVKNILQIKHGSQWQEQTINTYKYRNPPPQNQSASKNQFFSNCDSLLSGGIAGNLSSAIFKNSKTISWTVFGGVFLYYFFTH